MLSLWSCPPAGSLYAIHNGAWEEVSLYLIWCYISLALTWSLFSPHSLSLEFCLLDQGLKLYWEICKHCCRFRLLQVVTSVSVCVVTDYLQNDFRQAVSVNEPCFNETENKILHTAFVYKGEWRYAFLHLPKVQTAPVPEDWTGLITRAKRSLLWRWNTLKPVGTSCREHDECGTKYCRYWIWIGRAINQTITLVYTNFQCYAPIQNNSFHF